MRKRFHFCGLPGEKSEQGKGGRRPEIERPDLGPWPYLVTLEITRVMGSKESGATGENQICILSQPIRIFWV